MSEYCSKSVKRVIGSSERNADGDFLITQCHHMNLIEGELYLSEMLSHRVKVFKAEDGSFIRSIGELGCFDGEFEVPAGAALLEGNAVICDLNNHRLQTFDLTGSFLSEFGSEGDGPGSFANPNSICVDQNTKMVYIAEASNKRVQVFDKDFNHVRFITGRSSDDQFKSCNHVSFDSVNNRLIVSDSDNDSVSLFDSSTGSFLFSLQGDEGEFSSVARSVADKDGNILVCEMGKNKVMMFDGAGKKIGQFAEQHEFAYPEDIAIDKNGDIFILEGSVMTGWNKITVF
eukprot:gene8792-9731_t